jgi:cytochrome P450
VLIKLKTIWGGYSSPISRIPGPWYSRYTKLVLGYHILTGRRMFYIDDLHQMYGSVVRITPTEVAVADMAGVTQIHKIGSGFLKSSFYDLLVPSASETPGLFAMRDPHAHGIRRKFFARPFSNTSLKTHWEQEVRRKAELAVQKIREDASSAQNGADILKWWTLMATDVIAHISFGESFHMIETGKVSLILYNRQAGKAKHLPENSIHRCASERSAGCSATL